MRKGHAPVIVAVAALFIVVPLIVGAILFSSELLDYTSVLFFVLFLVPVFAGFIGLLLVSAHPRSYRFNHVPSVEERDVDPLRHAAVGAVQAVLQDMSRGSIAAPSVYSVQLRQMMEAEFHAMQIFRERGFRLHFAFHHNETHQIHTRHVVHQHEYVVEVDGLYDYYFEREGQLFGSPNAHQQVDPLVRVPGFVRLRLVMSEDLESWQLVGWSENIRGLQMGLATQ